MTFFFAWWARELLTYFIYFKAIRHPRTVKWGKNTYRLSLGGHTELMHGPGGPGKGVNGGATHNGTNGILPKRTKSIDLLPLLANEMVSPSNQGQTKMAAGSNPVVSSLAGSGVVPKTSAGIATAMNGEHTWRHFSQNGYIRGSLDRQHIALISDA